MQKAARRRQSRGSQPGSVCTMPARYSRALPDPPQGGGWLFVLQGFGGEAGRQEFSALRDAD